WADGNCWAPAIEEKVIDGKYKYFLYFSGNPVAGGGKQIGVAVADSPTGPFTDLGHPIITDSPTGHGQQIDVDVFTDPVSGKSYLYWGNGYMAGAELAPDMTSIVDSTITVMTPKGGTLKAWQYREAPYVFYNDGKYYFMWSVDDPGSPNYHVAYGTSDSPLGPITVAKNPVILSQDPARGIYGPAHNSVVKTPATNDWRIVYHRINENYLNDSPGIHREVCIDPMTINPDGTIAPVQPTR
ncbi:MAG: family 43 glycosylhydrolase, partial [Muribaculaceae bacterium]|nr:family 43 glycosylhydrolase [Muribaculaceae bacterium]